MSQRRAVTFVVMAGGRGERLWPLVRRAVPKVCLSPDGRRSLLQATIDRLRRVWPSARWLIVTTREQAEAVRASVPVALRRRVLAEPQAKNTAACITLAAVLLEARDPRGVMVVVPADHWIAGGTGFRSTLRAAIRAATAHDALVTIGIRPTHPHPGLGYLCTGSALRSPRRPRVFRLERFIEKPAPALAHRLVSRVGAWWNSGMFIGTSDKFLESIAEWLPDHARRFVPLADDLRHGLLNGDSQIAADPIGRRLRQAYRTLDAVSFDHGVMDHLRGGLVVEGRFQWADLGSWDAWARVARPSSRAIAVDCTQITIVGQRNHLVATVGVRNLLVVQTPTATLICRPDRAQAVREVVKRVAANPLLAPYR